ncbi:MAG: DUF3598 family protein [Prochloraceae cyanobacterium]|nr:DUF3598 family protein [Prochloraceae cyanobacterium]
MNPQEQNWLNLFGTYPEKGISWQGIWTSYSPDKTFLESHQGVRSFKPNENQTVINQTNIYTYSDGSKEEKHWQIDKKTCNQPDGLIHPASESARAVSFGNDANAWISTQLNEGKFFGCELFFRYEDWRTSIVPFYGKSGSLEKIVEIREHLDSFSDLPPAAEVETISGKWVGRKQSMTPDLKISPTEEFSQLVLDPTEGKNETILLSDRVVVNVPKKIQKGEEFELVAGKFVTEKQYKRLTVKYDRSGAFNLLVYEVFDSKD